jgi:hypothetical protein
MSFEFSDRFIEEYATNGAVIFRGILPSSLVSDLRRATEDARQLARDRHGPQAQRLQPVAGSGLDMKPFEDYRDLAPLREAIAKVVSPEHSHGQLDMIGVLLEPADLPWCTAWHRDGREIIDEETYFAGLLDLEHGHQVNCALYDDFSTWFITGSDKRPDLPHEKNIRPIHPAEPDLTGMSYVERERFCLHYAQSMPGAVRLHLHAGDFALYRACGWHLGSYLPHCKRTTLHEGVFSPKVRRWWNEHIAPAFLPQLNVPSQAA